MNKIFIGCIIFFLSLCLFVFSSISLFAQSEQISSFHSDITIQEDATILVTETIVYDFGLLDRHGIFRTIPVHYKNQDGKTYQLQIGNMYVTDELENGRPFSVTEDNGEITLKIGDPDRTVTGIQTYVISYSMRGPIQYFSDHDELYWNVTGSDWTVPIGEASAAVVFNEQIAKEAMADLKGACFTGYSGSEESNCRLIPLGIGDRFATNQPLSSGEGLTVAVAFPKNVVDYYQMEEVADYNWLFGIVLIFYAIIGYLILPLFFLFWWWIKGRDPSVSPVTVRQFDPPKNAQGNWISPIEVGTLVDEVIHPRDISASIVSLAIRKYIIIKEYPRKLAGLVKGDIEFLPGPILIGDPELLSLNKHEKSLIKALGLDEKASVKVKSLGNTFAKKLDSLKDDVYDDLVKEGIFPENPKKVRTIYLGFAIASLFIGNVLLSIILFILSRTMSKRTLKGAEAKREALGLLQFLKSQERHYKFQEDRGMLFEKLLPYAIVFGVAHVWAERFSNLTDYQPDWYQSSSHSFTPVLFTNVLNDSLNSVQSSYTPTSSSSSSGFSSGFSGGSSGGGFGGGGGGSW